MSSQLLGGRYAILKPLGGGGFSRTYLARDRHRPGYPPCVVKQLKTQFTNFVDVKTAKQLFEREAEVLEHLGNHDRIPRLFAYFEENQKFYLIQEFIEGRDLDREFGERGVLPEADVIGLLQETLKILEFVHQNHAIHRDIKPSNLIRRQTDRKIFLIDFGAVKQFRHLTSLSSAKTTQTIVVGSQGYMPNEQLAGSPRPCSDIYALGMLCIQALTNILPRDLARDPETHEITWRNQVSINTDFANVIDRMVCYDFRQRYQTATEVLSSLRSQPAKQNLKTKSQAQPLELIVDYFLTESDPVAQSVTQTLPSKQHHQSDLPLVQEIGILGSSPNFSLEFPGRPLPPDSPFYIKRPPIEDRAYEEIAKPGSVIRIKAPRRTGKSSLLNQIISHAKKQNYKIVSLDFQEADESIFDNLDKFLRWFCANISRQLKLKPLLDDYWDPDMGSKVNCTLYFEAYLLEKTNRPIVLALNEVNRVFEYAAIAQDFLPLLRYWHEQANKLEVFEKLRLIVVHSTEIYVPLKINQSPFNIGLPLTLPEFTLAQVKELAGYYRLNWHRGTEADQLMAMVGGHPYLVQLALYYLYQGKITLEKLLEAAPTQAGIYGDHLRMQWDILAKDEKLAAAAKQVFSNQNSVQLEPILAHKLDSMGLVKLNGNECMPSRNLYRRYFTHCSLKLELSEETRLGQLEQENQALKSLVNLDFLTQIYNRRSFNLYLEQEWDNMKRQNTSLSLLMLDIDYFKLYNDTYGHPKGDLCLQQVAQCIQTCLYHPDDCAARYGGEEFSVILPKTTVEDAVQVARRIQKRVKSLNIEHRRSPVKLGIVTVSIGVASTVPTPAHNTVALIRAADDALYQSKQQGRDRITSSSKVK